MPLARSASVRARAVRQARSRRHALSSVTFSRSSSPMRPRRCESVTAASGHSSARMTAACSSHDGSSGEKTDATAREPTPVCRNRRGAARMPALSNGTIGRPSYSCPPSSMTTSPRTSSARSSGQSTNGGSDALAGRPMRTAATRVRPRRWTTALVKWVVPIMTALIVVAGSASSARSVGGLFGMRLGSVASSSDSARVTPPVTSAVVGVFTAATTRSPSRRTASVLVPPTSMPIRRRSGFAGLRRSTVGLATGVAIGLRRSTVGLATGVAIGLRRSTVGLATGVAVGLRRSTFCPRSPVFISREDRAEVEVVAEGARAHVLQALRRQEDRGGGERDDGHALAVAQRLGTDGIARDRVEHADEVRRRHARRAVEPADGELVLEGEGERVAAVRVQPLQRGGAAQKSLRRAARDVLHLAREEPQPTLGVDHRLHGVAVLPARGLHGLPQPHGLAGRIEDAALLHFLARAGRLARAGDGADGDARRAGQPLHPRPRLRARDDDGVVAHVGERERVHRQVVDREGGHLRLGEGAAHAVAVHHGQAEHGRGHERLDRVAAADLERHHGGEAPVQVLLHHPHRALDGARIGEPLLADQRRTHVGDDGHEVVVGEVHRIHQPHDHALAVEPAPVQQREVRAAAAAGAQDPGADRERLDLGGADVTERRHQKPVNSSSPTTRAMPSTTTSATPMATADTAAAVGSKEYLRYANSSMGSGVRREEVRNNERVKLSNEIANAKMAPATTPGLITPNVTSRNARTGWAPRLWAASSRARSKWVRVAVTVRTTYGVVTTTWPIRRAQYDWCRRTSVKNCSIATPVRIWGSSRGEVTKAFTASRPRKRPRTSAMAASVPASVDSTAVDSASSVDSRSACMNSRRAKKLANQRSEKPCGGNVKNEPLLKAATTTTSIGTSKNAYTADTAARRITRCPAAHARSRGCRRR